MTHRLLARYDNAALRPPAALAREDDWAAPRSDEMAAWLRLKQWCFQGAGTDGVQTDPMMASIPFASAVLHGAQLPARLRLAEALCQDLDGSVQMAALDSGPARLLLRLRVKFNEALAGRRPQRTDPWDSGYVRDHPAGLERLRHFTPRRSTLIVAAALPTPALQACMQALADAQSGFLRVVRLLIVADDADLPQERALATNGLAQRAVTFIDMQGPPPD